MAERPSSLDKGYVSGGLSLFPDALDDKDSLYEVRNNAETTLRSGLPYNGKKIIVEDTSSFPDKGLIRVGPPPGKAGEAELVYYGAKTDTTFNDLIRGFAGSRQGQWPSGSWATNSVAAEPHNAVKDALINIERRIGLLNGPSDGTLHRRLRDMELKFLSPKPTFRAFPKRAKPGDHIRFQTLCESNVIRHLWDFGDGSQSVEKNPVHVYAKEGTYTVKLHLITDTGAQGIASKTNYITVSADENSGFFYYVPVEGQERTYRFIDQTDGDIKQRFWVFGDKSDPVVQKDPNIHEVTHTYLEDGTYEPSLLVAFANDRVKRIFLPGGSLEVS
jgi:hypothetical protein